MFGMHCFHDNGYMILQMWRLSMKMCDQCNMLPWSLLWQLTNDGFVLYCDQFEGCKLAPSFPRSAFFVFADSDVPVGDPHPLRSWELWQLCRLRAQQQWHPPGAMSA